MYTLVGTSVSTVTKKLTQQFCSVCGLGMPHSSVPEHSSEDWKSGNNPRSWQASGGLARVSTSWPLPWGILVSLILRIGLWSKCCYHSILEFKKLRCRKVKSLPQGHIALNCWTAPLTPLSLLPTRPPPLIPESEFTMISSSLAKDILLLKWQCTGNVY